MADAPSGATGPDQSPVKPKGGALGFLSTSTGRVVLAGIVLFIIVVAVGAIAFFFLMNGGQPQQAPTAPSGSGAKATTSTIAVTPTSPRETRLDETFTFRNIFAPSVSPQIPDTDDSDGSGDSDTPGNGSDEENTLILQSITRDSGERVATFTWNGTEYQVREGEQVDASPWEVISLSSDSALMLFGDSRITLTVGQGFHGDSSSK